MSRFLPASLKVTIPLILLGFALALSVLNVAYQVPREEQAVEEDHRERLLQELSRLQSSLEYLLHKGDMEGARREVAILASNRNYTVVALTDDQRMVIAATQRAWLGHPAAQVLPKFDHGLATQDTLGRGVQVVLESDKNALLGYADIPMGVGERELRSSRIGQLLFEYDLKRAKSAARTQIVAQSLYWTAWVTALAAVLWIVFHYLWTGRTNRLVRAAEQLAAGNLAARSGVRGRDELARLGQAFDAMADEVARTQTRLQEDIAERIKVQQELLASQEQYRIMFNAAVDGLALWSADGAIVDINPALWMMYGYSHEEFLARDPDKPIRQARRPALDLILPSVARGEAFHTELTDHRKDGSAMELEVRGIPMEYRGQTHVLTITRDITEKKRAEKELARQREMLHQREKLAALGSLLAGVAHELNNPLSVVVARAAILEEKADPATRGAASKIRVAAERCARIVRTFLAMARQQQPERVPVFINEVASAALDITGYALRSSGVEVELDLAADAPPVLADADQLHQVFMNLTINAQQALQEKPLPRTLKLKSRYDPATKTICIVISDNGPGMQEAVKKRVFEPYFTTKPMGSGTGVGLAVSLGIVEAHGGSITVDSSEGAGATFTIVLPAADAAGPDAAQTRPAHVPAGQRWVLVVDDEAEVRETLSEILTVAGHRVVAVASGREALDRLGRERFDVILTDIRMPDVDGRALYREVERMWPERVAQIVFVSGDTLATTLREFAEETGRPILEKPFLPADVRRVVAEVANGVHRSARQ
ncbi:MAG TPA: ATP-binding protein [Burkholderiales bacterium]|nr:ATP-binding protein [Burkholderiales bacterium]